MVKTNKASIFQLQQFSLKQSLSGMKVCSDSLIFGAMIPLHNAKRILDIGAGTGILSLMQAQKTADLFLDNSTDSLSYFATHITAVELTKEAAMEASDNFEQSPWADRLALVEQDIQSFAKVQGERQFDVIICNPPFFSEHSKTDKKDPLRHAARHTDSLSFEALFASIDLLLTSSGNGYFLVPLSAQAKFMAAASHFNMVLVEQTDIAESESHAAKVSVLKFVRQKIPGADIQPKRLNKFVRLNEHSDAVKDLLCPFLLRYR